MFLFIWLQGNGMRTRDKVGLETSTKHSKDLCAQTAVLSTTPY